MSESLKPCAHCHSNNINRFTILNDKEDVPGVMCLDCDTTAPEKVWNNRPGEKAALEAAKTAIKDAWPYFTDREGDFAILLEAIDELTNRNASSLTGR